MAELRHRHSEEIIVPRPGGVFSGGFRAGLYAGLVSLLIGMIASWGNGTGFWTPLQAAAATAYGIEALVSGPQAVVTGAVLWFLATGFLGIVFAMFTRSSWTGTKAFWTGLAYGAGVWLVLTYGVLPDISPTLELRNSLAPGTWLFQCLVFGAMLYRTPRFRREASHRAVVRAERRQHTTWPR